MKDRGLTYETRSIKVPILIACNVRTVLKGIPSTSIPERRKKSHNTSRLFLWEGYFRTTQQVNLEEGGPHENASLSLKTTLAG